jgi:hypothetical protein
MIRRGSHIFNRDGADYQPFAPVMPYHPEDFRVLISVRGWADARATVRLEGLGQLKNMMTSSRIEPVTSVCSAMPQRTVPLRAFVQFCRIHKLE